MTHNDARKLCVIAIRYYPPLASLILIIHIALLLCDVHLPVDYLVDSSILAVVLWHFISYGFGFCIWHRTNIVYAWLVSLCIDFEQRYGFGEYLIAMRILMLVLGLWAVIGFCTRCNCRQDEIHD